MRSRDVSVDDHRSALHHEAHLSQRVNVLGRIALDGDQVREQSRSDCSELSVELKDSGVDHRGRLQRLHRCETVLDEELELARIIAMREGTNVAAVTDGDTGGASLIEALASLHERGRNRIDTFAPPAPEKA